MVLHRPVEPAGIPGYRLLGERLATGLGPPWLQIHCVEGRGKRTIRESEFQIPILALGARSFRGFETLGSSPEREVL
jgi:hypothetical protein